MKKDGVLGHIFTVGGLTAMSRVLGLVREMLQSRLIGAGIEQSAFTLAFAIPNMARKLFGEGALTAAFVPVFKGEIGRNELDSARRLANAVMTMVLMILVSVVVLVTVGLTSFAFLADLSPRASLTLKLVRILLPYMIFICAAAFGMGVLNALGKFAEGAFMPAMLNFIWIATLGALCFFPSLSLSARVIAVCWAILVGGVLQMLFLFRCMAKKGFPPRFSIAGLRDEKVKLVWRNTFVAAIGAGAVQINYMLDQILAQCAAPWAAGVIGYAERLMDLPLGVIGVAFGTVLLPTFAGFFAKHDLEGARNVLSTSLINLMTVMIPAGFGLGILAPEITAVVYQGNAFDAIATVRVSRALAVYALGLAFFGYQKSLIPWFQAQGDMKTPLRVSVWTVLVNAGLNILAVWLLPEEWRHVGLAGSTVVCALLGCVLLTVFAHRRNGNMGLFRIITPLAKIVASSLLMVFAVGALRQHLLCLNRIIALALLIAEGMAVYSISLFCLRVHTYKNAKI